MASNRTRLLIVCCFGAGLLAAGLAAAQEPSGTVVAGGGLVELIRKGRWLMMPIILCSVIGLTFIFERFLGLRRRHVAPEAFLERIAALVARGEVDAAERACREADFPLAKILRSVLLAADGTRMAMEASLENEGARVIWQLRRNGKVLGVIAGVAPLLGLLGTVWGMMRAFATFALYARVQGVPPTDQLAVGINEALVTTAAGLAVAIPCLLFNHYFRGKADALVREMEDEALELIHTLASRARAGGPSG